MSESEAALSLRAVERTFEQAGKSLPVLQGASLEVGAGEIVALVGPSGAGKSTLLQIAGLLESPDAGDVLISGQSCGAMNDADRTSVRRERLGFVYQYHHLLPEFSAEENIVLPQMIAGKARPEAKVRAQELLQTMGLADRHDHRPARLSGGEQQRVAIARGVANLPNLLLADEPTGNLDPGTADHVFNYLVDLCRAQRIGVLVATHNLALAGKMDRIVALQDGLLVDA